MKAFKKIIKFILLLILGAFYIPLSIINNISKYLQDRVEDLGDKFIFD